MELVIDRVPQEFDMIIGVSFRYSVSWCCMSV